MTVGRKALRERKSLGLFLIVLIALASAVVVAQESSSRDKAKDKEKKTEKKKESDKPGNAAPSVSLSTGSVTDPSGHTIESVGASVETEPVPNPGDAADDPAIWVNPADVSQSTIIGTDKRGGLAVYDLTGKELQYLRAGLIDNVDLRTGFKLGGQSVALVTGGNRKDNSIAILRVNPQTRQLEDVAARTITTVATYGSCMYRNPKSQKVYYFVTSKSGNVEQWELFDNGQGKVDGRKVREFKVGGVIEGCVADDELGTFYVSEEAVGIWKYGAEPETGSSRMQVDKTGPGGHLVADVEGLAIAYGPNGTGFLIASSQGNHSYVVYRREGGHAFVKSFRIVPSDAVDGAEETDGIDVIAAPLGPSFPHGLFVAQDGFNDKGNQNFKLVPLERILGTERAERQRAGSN